MNGRRNRSLSLYIMVVLILLCSANLFSQKCNQSLEMLRGTRKIQRQKTTFINNQEKVSYPIAWQNLTNNIDIIYRENDTLIYCIVQTDGKFDRFREFGITVNSKIEDYFTCALDFDQIDFLISQEDILRIEPGTKCDLCLDTSLICINMDVALDSFNLKGNSVIVGIVDAGIDIHNHDFCEPGDTSKTRILYDFKVLDSQGPSPFTYGTEYTKSQIDNNLPFNVDWNGHGTAVMGIACGNGMNTGRGIPTGTYKGVASEANIICFDFEYEYEITNARVIDGVSYIADKADSLGMPCAINLSLGSKMGPRDGTSPFESALSAIASYPGVIIVNASGNFNYVDSIGGEKGSRCHAIRCDKDTVKFFAGSAIDSTRETIKIQIWYPGDQDYWVMLLSPNNDTLAYIGPNGGTGPPGQGYSSPYGCYAVHNENFADTGQYSDQYPNTYDNEIYIYLGEDYMNGQFWPITSDTFKIVMDSGQGKWDTYIYYSNTKNQSYIIDYDNEGTIHEPSNAYNVISVGAYTSRSGWFDIQGYPVNWPDYYLGQECYFSSVGPTRDGRTKPEIYAPGAWIASSVSEYYILVHPFYFSYLAQDSCHMFDRGTSLSAPHISGLVALMLEVDPTLPYSDVLYCLQSTSSNGYDGKVNAYDALVCAGAIPSPHCQGRCGDANSDGPVNISDAVWVINYVFIGGPEPLPVLACGDANTDATVNVSDAVYIIEYTFQGGPDPGDCSSGSWTGQGGNCCPF